MTISYLRDVQPLEATLSDAQIAAKLSADPGRYPVRKLFPGELATELARNGHADPAALLDRMLAGIATVGESRPSVKTIAGPFAANEGTLDFGSPLVKSTLAGVAANGTTGFTNADAEAVAAVAPDPDPITEAAVARSRVAHDADQYAGRLHEAIATARDQAGYTAATIKAAVDAVEV